MQRTNAHLFLLGHGGEFSIWSLQTTYFIFFDVHLQLQCDWAQIQVIVLTNDGNGFGFGISGSRNSGAVVRNIFPGGAADRVSKVTSVGRHTVFHTVPHHRYIH